MKRPIARHELRRPSRYDRSTRGDSSMSAAPGFREWSLLMLERRCINEPDGLIVVCATTEC
jgi:hypothetical protein